MFNIGTAVPDAGSATFRSHTDENSARKAFYARVRQKFLEQSARYFRDGLNEGKTAPFARNNFDHP